MAASPRKATSIDREPPATRRDTQIRPFSLGRLVILAILGVLIVWPLSNRDVSQISLLEEEDDAPKTALILTAHPDDEVMFFTPTILGLIAAGWQVSALCLCTGQYLYVRNTFCGGDLLTAQVMEMDSELFGRQNSSRATKGLVYPRTESRCLMIRESLSD